MTTYYPVENQQAGEEISARLWELCRPPEVRQPNEITVRLYNTVRDALGGWWLEVPDHYAAVPVSAEITQAQIDAAVNSIETGGSSMNGNTKNAIKNRIGKAKGKSLALVEMLGPKGKASSKPAA